MAILPSQFILLKEGAAIAHVSVRTIKRWFGAGLLSFQPIPRGKILIASSDLSQFLNRRSRPGPELDRLVNDAMHELVDAGRNGHGPNKQKNKIAARVGAQYGDQ